MVLFEWALSGHDDPERMIEWWAREQGTGVYSRDHRRAELESSLGAIFGRDAAA